MDYIDLRNLSFQEISLASGYRGSTMGPPGGLSAWCRLGDSCPDGTVRRAQAHQASGDLSCISCVKPQSNSSYQLERRLLHSSHVVVCW